MRVTLRRRKTTTVTRMTKKKGLRLWANMRKKENEKESMIVLGREEEDN